eukprot:scaffold10334_cov71-Phaeocystis_antarctica.AAC.4
MCYVYNDKLPQVERAPTRRTHDHKRTKGTLEPLSGVGGGTLNGLLARRRGLYSKIGEELGADQACDRHSDDVHQHLDGRPCVRCVDAIPVQEDG